MMVNIEKDEIELINTMPKLKQLAERIEEQIRLQSDWENSIQAARSNYIDDDLEIDETPALSVADDGVWVAAWVWVATYQDEEG